MFEAYEVRIEGVRPLLMNALLTHTQTQDEYLDPKSEAEMRLYKDPNGNVCIPAKMVKACLVCAGKNYVVEGIRMSAETVIRAGIRIKPEYIPLEYDKWVVDSRPAVVRRSRVIRHRPRFDRWALEFNMINLDPSVLRMDTLRKMLEDAGKWCGLGDYRPEYGLFRVTKFEKT